MKKETKRRLKDLPMSWVMGVTALVGVVLVPTLWLAGYQIWAVSTLLIVFLVLIQAACIDLPGSPYRVLERLWAPKNANKPKP